MARYSGLPGPQTPAQPLEAVHDGLFRQQLGLQDFVGNVMGMAGAALSRQQKLLAKVINPLVRTAEKRLNFHAATIHDINNTLRAHASARIAEQNIQLGQSLAALPPTSRRTVATAFTAASPARPYGAPIATAKPAKKDPLDADPETTGLLDSDLLGTTEATSNALAGATSAGTAPDSGESEQPAEDVTNVIALRSCDLKAIVEAIKTPHYNPLVDTASVLPKAIVDKLSEYYGADLSQMASANPVQALASLLAAETQGSLEGRVVLE